MDHRPFEDWLLLDEPLSPQQKRELAAHLQTCQTCSALAEVDIVLNSVKPAEPRPGFSSRFQERLKEHKRLVQRRNSMGFFVLAVDAMGFLTGLTWPWIKVAVESPVDLVSSWLSSLIGSWASLQALLRAGLVLFRVAPGFLPGYVWAIVLISLTGWSALWIVSLLKYSQARRITG